MKVLRITYLFLLMFLSGTLVQVSAQTTFADNFTTQTYNRNDGTGNWSTNWIETNDDGSANSGDAFIFLGLGNVLAFINGTGHGINRTVNLSGASSATLTFDWRAEGLDVFAGGQEELGIFISNNNGTTFSQIGAGTIVGTNTGTFSLDISAFISANTVFRLQVIGGNQTFEGGEFAFIDNLVISGVFGPSLIIEDLVVNENAGTVSFDVTHIGTNTAGGFDVNFATANNTATAGSDYTANSGTLFFSGTAGDTETINIDILENFSPEGTETFFINLSGVSDPTVNITDQGLETILEVENPRPYSERNTLNVRGNFDMIGNTNLTCTANCATPVANNPTVVMGNASIDGTTTNSSSADFTLPAGATVAWAGLYWGGSHHSEFADITNPDPSLNLQEVRFRQPGAGNYTTINANVTNIENTVSGANWSAFMSYADVTSLVQSAGSGTYTVADIPLITGSAFTGPFGGWSMVIVYEDPADITRSVSVWDGFDFFGFGANDSFTVTGLLTPSSGTFEVNSGYFGMDGDSGGFTGDFIGINGTPLSNALNPPDNTLNSTISKFGVDVGGRNPNQSFNWGVDIDIFDVNNPTPIVPNNATTLDVDLGSANEGIWGGVFVVSTEVAFPAVASKAFSPTTIGYGEESTVTLSLENPATGVDLTNLSLTDNLPSGMIISTSPNATSSCGGTITAISGSDNFSISGVSLPAGNNCTFTFDVIGRQAGSLDNSLSSGDITNDQNIPLAGTITGTLNVIIRSVITNRRITYRVNPN